MNQLTFAQSSDYARRTGGYLYNERLLRGLAAVGWQVRRVVLPAGFPDPAPAARAEATEAFRSLPDHTLVLVDQLCLAVLPEVARAEASRLRLVMIVHHPLALEYAHARVPDPSLVQRLAACEREALVHVAAAIATSPTTARMLTRNYHVPAERLIVAVPGVEPVPLARGSGGTAPVLLSVGAIVPRKDHGTLLEALAGLRHLPWRLILVGNADRAPDHVARLRARVAAAGLTSRIQLAGELSADALGRCWQRADLYVSASRHEGYGMALAEAIAHGLPVVTTRAGAVGDWIGHHGAKVVPSGSVAQLRSALREILSQPRRRAALRRKAIAHRRVLPTWEATAASVHRRLLEIGNSRS